MKIERCAVYLDRGYVNYKLDVYNFNKLDVYNFNKLDRYLDAGYEVERVDELHDPEHPALVYILKKEVGND